MTVIGSGHGRLADVTGGLAVAMQRLTSIGVDAEAGLARIGAGATWEPVLAATVPARPRSVVRLGPRSGGRRVPARWRAGAARTNVWILG